MAIAKKELVSCKGHQHLTLYRLETLRRIIKSEIDDNNMSWPSYTWYFDGKQIVVGAYGFKYEKDGAAVKNTGCYFKEIFRTVRQRDAIFAVEFFRVVYNAPSSSRHNYNPKGNAEKLFRGVDTKGIKKRPTRMQDSSTHPSSSGQVSVCERTGKPYNVSTADWINMLRCFSFGTAWKPNERPISCLALWLRFEEFIEDVERFATLPIEDIKDNIESIAEYAMVDDMEELAPRIIMAIKDIQSSLQCAYSRLN